MGGTLSFTTTVSSSLGLLGSINVEATAGKGGDNGTSSGGQSTVDINTTGSLSLLIPLIEQNINDYMNTAGTGGDGGDDGQLISSSTIIDSDLSGMDGSDGASPVGGGGGGGGSGIVCSADGIEIENNATIHGGSGGNGGLVDATAIENDISGLLAPLTQLGTINTILENTSGGDGGDGGNNTTSGETGSGSRGGNGGGGAGAIITGNNNTLTNKNTIIGGNGSQGGAGVVTLGDNTTIINAGSISGGLGDDGTQANAINFSGSDNTLELHDGYEFVGNIVGDSNDNTLILGGDISPIQNPFDVQQIGNQYTGFSNFVKNGNSTWTLTGSTSENTPWTIEAGTLQIDSDTALGDTPASLTFTGDGILQTTADITSNRAISLNTGANGTINTNGNDVELSGIISGDGNLIKDGDGTLTLSGANTYAGGTTITNGNLSINSNEALGTGDLTFTGGALQTTNDMTLTQDIILTGNGTINVDSDTELTLDGNISQDSGEYTFTKYDLGTLINNGDINVNGLVNQGSGTFDNNGTITVNILDNVSTFNNLSDGTLTNSGTLDNDNILTNTGILNNDGILINNGTLNNNFDGIMDNSGTLTNNINSTLHNYGNLGNHDGGILDNYGIINNLDNILHNNLGGVFNNSGTLNNAPTTTLINDGTLNNDGTLENSGFLDNIGDLNNNGTLTNSSDGTINIGMHNGESGTLNGNIINDGSLIFNRSNDSSYDGIISGSGSVTQLGTGTLTLSGDSSGYTGNTIVEAGTLHLAETGNLGGYTTVNEGATISGTGTVGNLMFNNGSNYKVDLMPETLHYLMSNGSIDLSHANLIINAAAGNYGPGAEYTILSGGISGEFSSISSTGATLQYGLTYNSDNVILTISFAALDSVVPQGNPGSVAQYLDTHAPAGLSNALNTLSRSQLESALNEMSPAQNTQHAGFIANTELAHTDNPFTWAGMDRLIQQSGQQVAQLANTLSSVKQAFTQLFSSKQRNKTIAFAIAQDNDPKHLPVSSRIRLGKANLWIQGGAGRFYLDNVRDPSGLFVQGLNGSTYDTGIGLDYAVSETLKLGVTTGYGYNTYKMKVNGDKGSTNSGRVGLYGLWEPTSEWYVNGSAYYGHHRFKADRIMTVIPATAHQKHDGHHVSGLIETGRDIALPESLTLTPYISAGAVYLHEDGYNETGAGFQNLSVRSRNSTTLQGKGGMQLAKLWDWDACTRVYSFARLGATYRRATGHNQKITASLIGQGGQFTVRTRNKDHLMVNPNVGFTANLSKYISTTLSYEGEIGSNQRNHQALLRFNWNF